MDLVDDDGVDRAQDLARLRRQQQEQRLRGGDQDVRGIADLAGAFRRGRIPRPDRDGHLRRFLPQSRRDAVDARQRCPKIVLHVDGEGLERGNVEDPHSARGLSAVPGIGTGIAGIAAGIAAYVVTGLITAPVPALHQGTDCPQERSQRLSGAGRRHHEGVLPLGNGLPRLHLHIRRLGEDVAEPGRHRRGEPPQGIRVSR